VKQYQPQVLQDLKSILSSKSKSHAIELLLRYFDFLNDVENVLTQDKKDKKMAQFKGMH